MKTATNLKHPLKKSSSVGIGPILMGGLTLFIIFYSIFSSIH